jgi:membrane fusion protein, multidrug efflux system
MLARLARAISCKRLRRSGRSSSAAPEESMSQETPALEPEKARRADLDREPEQTIKTSVGRRVLTVGLTGASILSIVLVFSACRGQTKTSSARRAVPVVGSPARIGDLGIYQTGLGTVVPISTVTVRSRVDGQLLSVGFREGQAVHKGDLLAELDPRPFEVQLLQAQGQRAKDESALANANLDLERYRALIATDSIPRQQLDTQAATVSQSEAALKSDQAQIESAQLNLTYCRITAPFSGVAGLRLVDPGNMVHAADPNGLVVITQQQPISVVFTIPADQLSPVLVQLRSGHKLQVEAWDHDLQQKRGDGSVIAIDNQIDATTGTVRIKAIFPNQDFALYPNQFVNARLLVSTLQKALLIPTAALQRGPQSTYVYVVKPDSTIELRNVAVQQSDGQTAALRGGIKPGEVVIVDGLDKLQPGTMVALAKNGSHGKKPAS